MRQGAKFDANFLTNPSIKGQEMFQIISRMYYEVHCWDDQMQFSHSHDIMRMWNFLLAEKNSHWHVRYHNP